MNPLLPLQINQLITEERYSTAINLIHTNEDWLLNTFQKYPLGLHYTNLLQCYVGAGYYDEAKYAMENLLDQDLKIINSLREKVCDALFHYVITLHSLVEIENGNESVDKVRNFMKDNFPDSPQTKHLQLCVDLARFMRYKITGEGVIYELEGAFAPYVIDLELWKSAFPITYVRLLDALIDIKTELNKVNEVAIYTDLRTVFLGV